MLNDGGLQAHEPGIVNRILKSFGVSSFINVEIETAFSEKGVEQGMESASKPPPEASRQPLLVPLISPGSPAVYLWPSICGPRKENTPKDKCSLSSSETLISPTWLFSISPL